VLVTGGSGFIGTNVCQHLLQAGVPTLNFDRAKPRNAAHSAIWKQGDVCDAKTVREALAAFAPDTVLHLAARTDLDGKTVADYSANTQGVENTIDAALACTSVRRVVFASSRLVCRIGYVPTGETDYCPNTPYGESKVEGERIVRARAAGAPWDWVQVRPTSIWGPWFGVPYKLFFDAVARDRYVHPKGLAVPKSFGFVGNTVHQLMAIAQAPQPQIDSKTIYLADYPPIEVAHMAQLIRAEVGNVRGREVPLVVLKALAAVGDLAKALGWKEPPLTSFRLANLMTPMVYDLAPLQQIVGPLPYDLAAGVKQTVAWMRAHGQLS
jgi:GlcNAc-P-P-Und epimerase